MRVLTRPDPIEAGTEYCSGSEKQYPLNARYVQLLILIITDVTKLAEDPHTRTQIQKKILQYVDGGGVVIGTHDIIYRRVRNEILQRAFGGKITNFRRETTPIDYLVVEAQKDHPIVAGLPPAFALDDGEVCWGSWAPDVVPLIVTKQAYDGDRPVPLVTVRSYSRGLLVWMSSCDKFEHLGRSIAEPQPEFVQLLVNTLRHSKEMRKV